MQHFDEGVQVEGDAGEEQVGQAAEKYDVRGIDRPPGAEYPERRKQGQA